MPTAFPVPQVSRPLRADRQNSSPKTGLDPLALDYDVHDLLRCHVRTMQGQGREGKIVFIANCRLRDKTRDHRDLYTGARCRPNRPTDESERTGEDKI